MLQISTELEEAAQVENVGFPRRFFKIVFPLSKGGMISGFMLVFISIMKELDADAALYGVRLFGGKSDSAVQCSDHRYVCAGILRLLVCKYLYGRGHHQGLLMREDMKDEQN
nr:ABC transporter permease subunit [Enterocloster clostridioformis]